MNKNIVKFLMKFLILGEKKFEKKNEERPKYTNLFSGFEPAIFSRNNHLDRSVS